MKSASGTPRRARSAAWRATNSTSRGCGGAPRRRTVQIRAPMALGHVVANVLQQGRVGVAVGGHAGLDALHRSRDQLVAAGLEDVDERHLTDCKPLTIAAARIGCQSPKTPKPRSKLKNMS